MPKIKLEDMETIVNVIGIYAADLELIPKNAIIEYGRGNASTGISATLTVVDLQTNKTRETVQESFLPTFTYKTTREQQYRELTATYKVLTAMVRVKNKGGLDVKLLVHPSNG